MKPGDRLDAFERKHGDYYELLDKVVSAKSDTDRREYDQLLRRHSRLVSETTGYAAGYADGLRDGAK